MRLRTLTVALALATATHATAVEWHDSLASAQEEAGTLGRAIVVVTTWRDGL